MRILVTGGAGFVGKHLCMRLLKDGHEVVALDNLATCAEADLSTLVAHDRFLFVNADVIDVITADTSYDRVYHLACPASPPLYQNDPIKTTKTCFLGTLHALGVAKKWGARFVMASTSEVYGDPEITPQPENYRGNTSCTGIRACYDEGKRVAETLCNDYVRMHGLDVRVARIFNTYGPGMHPYDGRVVSNFVRQAISGEDITVYGDGRQTRSFGYVEDLVDGLVLLMETPDVGVEAINLGNPGEFTMLELAHKVIELTSSKSKLVYSQLPCDDPKHRKPDISRAECVLGWRPKVSLDNGLSSTIEYFKKLRLFDKFHNMPNV